MLNTILKIVSELLADGNRQIKDRDRQIGLADSYLGRMRSFQNQLLIWSVSLNLAAVAYIFKDVSIRPSCPIEISLTNPYIVILVPILMLFLNALIAALYRREHNNSHRLLSDFPELDLLGHSGSVPRNYGLLENTYTAMQIVYGIICGGILMYIKMECCI